MSLRVAVVGCCHGELDAIYAKLSSLHTQRLPELLIICGDFQALRSNDDFSSIAMPDKYKRLGDFHQYYTGKRIAPVTTIFVGGNHECGDYLAQLPFGGWVAPKIWYMGPSGVVWYRGLRIAGMSGIFKDFDFYKSHHEIVPLEGRDLRSFYHTRFEDVLKLALLRDLNLNCVISHDWPEGIGHHGNLAQLLKRKPFFKADIEKGELGNPHYMTLLKMLMPNYWFSAHLHVKFEAQVNHDKKRRISDASIEAKRSKVGEVNDDEIDLGFNDTNPAQSKNDDEIPLDIDDTDEVTRNGDEINLDMEEVTEPSAIELAKGFTQTNFLALSKPLPNHPFFEVVDIPITNGHVSEQSNEMYYDKEFLKIIKWSEQFKLSQGFRRLRMDQLTPAGLEQMYRDIGLVTIPEDLSIAENFEATLDNPAAQTQAFKHRYLGN